MSRISKALFLIWFTVLSALMHPARADVVIIPSIPYSLTNGTIADASQVMGDLNTILSYVNANAAGNGVNTSITQLTGLLSPPSGAGSLLFAGASVAGTANAITVPTTYPGAFQLVQGECIWWTPTIANTGSATMNVASTGAVSFLKLTLSGLQQLTGGELVAGQPNLACYNGGAWIVALISNAVEAPIPYSPVTAAATTSVYCAYYKCLINGSGVTITAFTSSSPTGAYAYVTFSGINTLVNSGALALPGGSNITTAPNDTAIALNLGGGNFQVTSYTHAIQPINAVGGVAPSGVGVSITNAGTPNTQIALTAQSATLPLSNYTGSVTCTNLSVTLDLGTAGGGSGNDLDAGTIAASTWYHVYAISNGSTCAGLASTSSTSPTLPSGYIYLARLGAMSTDGSAHLYRTRQLGPKAAYQVVAATNTPTLPVLVNGATGNPATPTWTAVQVTGAGKCAPPTAVRVEPVAAMTAAGASSDAMIVAPNNAYGGVTSTSNAPPLGTKFGNVAQTWESSADFVLESNSIYAAATASSATSVIYCKGWTDAVAAN